MTIIFIIGTVIFSALGFQNKDLFDKYKFNAYMVFHKKEWYRLLSYGFLHGDWFHLGINMFVLYSFGSNVELHFNELETYDYLKYAKLYYVALYVIGILVSTLWSLYKHKNDHSYNAIGASGAVSAVVFTSVFFNPTGEVLFFMVIPLPGFIFGLIYLAYSHYMSKKNIDNIGHDAHFVGAVFGFLFPLFIDVKLFRMFFLNDLFSYSLFN